MCRIKIGEDITQLHDVQNLITAYILRSKEPYTISYISDKVKHSCIGSNLDISSTQITEMVRETTLALLRAKYISSNAGYYYALPVSTLKK